MAGRKKMIELPSELVVEILARFRLRVWLVQSRCVCKRWKLLLEAKDFINKQMTYAARKLLAIEDNGESPPRSILYEQGNNGEPKMTLEEADLTCGDKRLVELDVIGHCYGLFYLRLQDRTLAVWNPFLRQVLANDDYKIVWSSRQSETIMAPKEWSRGKILHGEAIFGSIFRNPSLFRHKRDFCKQ